MANDYKEIKFLKKKGFDSAFKIRYTDKESSIKTKNKGKRKKRGSPSTNLGKVFDKHLKFEFEDEDIDLTMKTMANYKANYKTQL